MAEGAELENFQVLCPDNLPKVRPDIFLASYNAWEQHKCLKLGYRSARNHVSEKLFEPHIFAWNGGCWYLKGKLLQDNDRSYDPPKIQVLALHRIEQAEILQAHFWPEPSILESVRNSGLFDFDKIPEVELEILDPFDLAMAPGFAEKIIDRGDGFIRIRLKDIPKYEAVQIILSTWGNVRVLAPESLKERIRKIANKLLRNNK